MLIRQTEDRLSLSSASSPERLGPEQRQHLATVVAGLGSTWSVELHYDALGEASIVVLPEDLEDVIGPTLIVHAYQSSFHLEELCGDAYRTLGKHHAWADVCRAVRIRLIWEMAFSMTLH
jgi:hypothetical protein